MSASLGLYRLQVVDSRLDEIRARLNEIIQLLENDTELKKALVRVDKADKAHNKAWQSLKIAEQEVKAQKIKIEQSETKLYSGSVKNPKELQDLQHEVAALKRYLDTLEDRQLEAMLEEENHAIAKQKEIDASEQLRTNLENQNKDLIEEQGKLKIELERYESERQATLPPLDKNLLAVYDDLRQQKRGIAVTLVSDGACAACGTTLTPALNQSVRQSSQICYCPSCKRILFAN